MQRAADFSSEILSHLQPMFAAAQNSCHYPLRTDFGGCGGGKTGSPACVMSLLRVEAEDSDWESFAILRRKAIARSRLRGK